MAHPYSLESGELNYTDLDNRGTPLRYRAGHGKVQNISRHPEQRTLQVLSALSYRTGELGRYLQEIALRVSELLRVDWSVVTFCKDGCERILASSVDLGEEADAVYSLHGTLTGTVIDTRASLVVEDATAVPDYGEPPEGYKAYLGVPLQTPAGEVIGTVCSFHCQPRHFNFEEVRLAQIFADRAATAIDNYQLYQHQQEINTRLQAEIQERQEVELALRQSEAQFRQLTENLEQVFWLISADNQPLYVSPAFEQVWQLSRQDWYANPNICWQAIHPDDRSRVEQLFSQNWQGKLETEYRIIRPDGSVRIIRDQAVAICDESGQMYRVAGLAEDMTEQKQAEQERLKAIASLAEVGQLAAMIVHEIRNPLTTVWMGLNAFQRLELPHNYRERLDLAMAEAERLRNLLREILLYAKPQALEPQEIDLNPFIRNILEPMRSLPIALGRRLKFIPADHPLRVVGDQAKLKQVVINLVDNACEAIAEGEEVTCSLERDGRYAYIRIHNNGPAIPPELLDRLTKPFYTTKAAGTGLGLAIVKRIVEAHSGELEICSTPDNGTTVRVGLPLRGESSIPDPD
mgnify:CR=1 FL=1